MIIKDKIINRLEELNLKYSCNKGLYDNEIGPYHKINIKLDELNELYLSLIIFDDKPLDHFCIHTYLENKKTFDSSSTISTLEVLQKYNIWPKN